MTARPNAGPPELKTDELLHRPRAQPLGRTRDQALMMSGNAGLEGLDTLGELGNAQKRKLQSWTDLAGLGLDWT